MDGLRFSIVLGQRLSWEEMLANTRETEELGFDGLYLVDHFFGLKDVYDPTHEAWTMLAALAPYTRRLRLGVMVCGNTYRNPVFLLKQAITVDHVSHGRVDFGVGAGWLEREHEAYGFPFPDAAERVDRFAEALDLWDALQRNDRTTFEGRHYTILDAPFEPKALQPGGRLPVLIGASKPRMLRLVARHADIWNMVCAPEDGARANRRMDELCREIGRDPATLDRAVSPSLNLLSSREAFVEGVGAYREAGFRHITMPWPRTPEEVPVLRDVARTVIPDLRGAFGASPDPEPIAPGPRLISEADLPAIRDLIAGLDEPGRRFLTALAAQPDERFDGARLREELGLDTHAEVTRTVARCADAFAAIGFNRPWSEAQRGYALDAGMAALMRSLLPTLRPNS
jgi:alkanesulfonate monooxygenase SsuD/methylene tetrahydromethanopterin reductase-like flavin-dependent oxidoreductase (luciferase family)